MPAGSALDATVDIPSPALPDGLELPEAGEVAARRRWQSYVDDGLAGYDDARDRPDLDATSRMSVHLKWGEIHPRTMLADLKGRTGKGATSYRRELAFREFYADVLFQRPETARDYLRTEFAGMDYDEPDSQLEAWKRGRTGFPIVDAGMRQLRATGWMHNRVRMIVASFLVKDLHLEWQHGARHFLRWLVDGDLASNQHGWQWTAGLRHRRGAVLPGVQPEHAGSEVRPRRQLRQAMGARARRARRQARARAVDGAGRDAEGLPGADRRPLARSARRHWRATRGSSDECTSW